MGCDVKMISWLLFRGTNMVQIIPLVSFLWWPILPELCEKQHVVHDLQSSAEDEGPAKRRHTEQVSGKRWTDRRGEAARQRGDAGRRRPCFRCEGCICMRAYLLTISLGE